MQRNGGITFAQHYHPPISKGSTGVDMATESRPLDATEPHEEQEKINVNGDDHSSKGETDADDRQGSMTVDAVGAHEKKKQELGNDDKVEITEEDCIDELGFSYPSWKKWYILSVIFIVQVSRLPRGVSAAWRWAYRPAQVSMNFNTSLYSNALKGISHEFGVSEQGARCGAMIFLVTYGM